MKRTCLGSRGRWIESWSPNRYLHENGLAGRSLYLSAPVRRRYPLWNLTFNGTRPYHTDPLPGRLASFYPDLYRVATNDSTGALSF